MRDPEMASRLETENELLQLQLQQLQEELEHYYFAYKKLSDEATGSATNYRLSTTELGPYPVLLDKVAAFYGESPGDRSRVLDKELSTIRAELQSAYTDLKAQQELREQLRQELEATKTTNDALKAELQSAYTDLKAQQDLSEQLRQELKATKTTNDALKAERDSLTLSLDKKLKGLQRLVADRDSLRSIHESLKQKMDEQSIAYQATVDALRGELSASLTEAHQQHDNLAGRVKELERSEKAALQSVNLAQKMQVKAQSDLDSLRVKFRQKDKNEQQLVDLIHQLREKLKLASQFYHQLQETHPDLLEG